MCEPTTSVSDGPTRGGRRVPWLTTGPAFLGMILGLLFALQVTPAFKHGQGFGVFIIAAACVQVMYAMALAMRPWTIDDLGRNRDAGDARRVERHWYRAGIAGQSLVLLVLLAGQLGALHISSTPAIEWLTILLGGVVCAWLGYRITRQPPPKPLARQHRS